jgi:hypothetical protein
MLQKDPLRRPLFHVDADPDSAFYLDADPDPTFHSDADPDSASQNDPASQHCLQRNRKRFWYLKVQQRASLGCQSGIRTWSCRTASRRTII